jgi:hypothetical protein
MNYAIHFHKEHGTNQPLTDDLANKLVDGANAELRNMLSEAKIVKAMIPKDAE